MCSKGAASTYNVAMRRNQPARKPPTPSQPYHVPQSTGSTATQTPTYAQTVRSASPVQASIRGHREMHRNVEGVSLHGQPMLNRPTMSLQPPPQSIGPRIDLSNPPQYQFQPSQGPSYAEVVAGGPRTLRRHISHTPERRTPYHPTTPKTCSIMANRGRISHSTTLQTGMETNNHPRSRIGRPLWHRVMQALWTNSPISHSMNIRLRAG